MALNISLQGKSCIFLPPNNYKVRFYIPLYYPVLTAFFENSGLSVQMGMLCYKPTIKILGKKTSCVAKIKREVSKFTFSLQLTSGKSVHSIISNRTSGFSIHPALRLVISERLRSTEWIQGIHPPSR
jgi:hypothetical protein